MKSKCKWILIGVWLVVAGFAMVAGAYWSERNGCFVPIITYHRVVQAPTSELDVTPERFEEHLKFFQEQGYHPITASQLVEYQHKRSGLPSKPIVITFDDGPKSNFSKVFPLLKKYGWKSTFFIYPKVIAEKSATQLTWSELREMAGEGMDIQSHTLSHAVLTKITASANENYFKWLERELGESKQIIESKLEKRVTLLAYPYGIYNQLVEAQLFQAGYEAVFTTDSGNNYVKYDRRSYDRHILNSSMSLEQIQSLLEAIPLELDPVTPLKGMVVFGVTEIKFRIKNVKFDQVEMQYRGKISMVKRGNDGCYTYKADEASVSGKGFQTIIVKGYADRRNYLGSWGIDLQPPLPKQIESENVEQLFMAPEE